MSRRGQPRQKYRAPDIELFRRPSVVGNYWLGFLMADGCATDAQLIVVLQKRDADHLHSLAAALGCDDRPLAPANQDRARRLVISSAELARTVAGHGVVPRRTAPITPWLLESRDFWRGVFDGDGTLRVDSAGTPNIELVGRAPLIDEFARYLDGLLPEHRPTRPYRHSQSRAVRLVGCGGRRAKAVVDVLCRDASPVLARKAERASRILAWEPRVRRRYPWAVWGDGSEWHLHRGRDYDDAHRLWEAGRRAARELGCRLTFVDKADHVLLQFIPRSSHEDSSQHVASLRVGRMTRLTSAARRANAVVVSQ
jgi:hypothetical protein